MKKRILQVSGEHVALFEGGVHGPALFLLHGNGSSHQSFQRQWDSTLGKRYHFVTMDLPGHGQSDNAIDPPHRYCLKGYTALIHAVLEALGDRTWTFVGHSLGGHILLETLADREPDRVAGLMLIGAPPLRSANDLLAAYPPSPVENPVNQGASFEEKLLLAARHQVAKTSCVPPFFMADLQRADPRARKELEQAVISGGLANEVNMLKRIQKPVAIVAGTEEKVVGLDYLTPLCDSLDLWGGGLLRIDGAGHWPHWEQPDLFNPLLARFVDAVA
ncbi:MAG: alpha/beta hydrolase [Magnetococcales bacterium]|nr:alpha/beta hydrolase [Magnetococcales bacterium]